MKRFILYILLTMVLAIIIVLVLDLLKIDLPSVVLFLIGVFNWLLVLVIFNPMKDL